MKERETFTNTYSKLGQVLDRYMLGEKAGEEGRIINIAKNVKPNRNRGRWAFSLEKDIGLPVPKSGKLIGNENATEEVRAGGLAPSFQ